MLLAAIGFVAFFIWENYFLPFLQVVNDHTVTEAPYVGKTYNVMSCFWGLVVGVLIRVTGRCKWLALYFGIPLALLSTGHMMHFRQPHINIGYVHKEGVIADI